MIEYLLIAAGGYALGKLFDGKASQRSKQNEQRLDQVERDLNLTTEVLERHNYRLASVEETTRILEGKLGAIVDGSKCPECSRPMKLRRNGQKTSSSFGKFFFGCSGFPRFCKTTLNMPEDFVSQIAVREQRAS